MFYAIVGYKVCGTITTNMICDSSARAGEDLKRFRAEEYDLIENVVKVKGPQVVMPNGHKASKFIVNGETWMRYRDGSSEIVKSEVEVVEAKVEAKPTKKAMEFFANSKNFEEFAAQMLKAEYNEKYTLIQWNLCK